MVVVIAVAEMFGISGRRDELAALLERFEHWAAGDLDDDEYGQTLLLSPLTPGV